MATLDKEIKVIALRGTKGKTSYEEAVENELFSGTLEEWISTFATPDNYITRGEFQKVTQAQYDALKQAGQLVENCFYLIVDDTSYDDLNDALEQLQDDLQALQTTTEQQSEDLQALQDDLDALDNSFVDFEFTQAQNGTITLNTNVYEWLSNGGNPLTTKIRAKISLYISEENYQQRYAFLHLIKFQYNENPSDTDFQGFADEFYFGNNDYTLTLCQDESSTYHTIEFKQNKKYSHLITLTNGSNVMSFTLMNSNKTLINTSELLLANLISLGKHTIESGYDFYQLKLLAGGTYNNANIYYVNITNTLGTLNVYSNNAGSSWNMNTTTIEDFVY